MKLEIKSKPASPKILEGVHACPLGSTTFVPPVPRTGLPPAQQCPVNKRTKGPREGSHTPSPPAVPGRRVPGQTRQRHTLSRAYDVRPRAARDGYALPCSSPQRRDEFPQTSEVLRGSERLSNVPKATQPHCARAGAQALASDSRVPALKSRWGAASLQ